jgi:hypothetical protein
MSGTAGRLRAHVEMLADHVGERHIWRPDALARAADYIRGAFVEAGYVPGVQAFAARGVAVHNIEVLIRGSAPDAEAIVIGAHYDTVTGSPGANDNGTGIASVLELARRFAGRTLPRTLRFVAFVNEEPPFFQTEEMGSLVYARAARARGDRIGGMLSLETMGYYADEPGSQQYPEPLEGFFPDTGDFIAVVGNMESGALVRRIRAAFTAHGDFPIQAAPMPAELPGAGWSDHWSFWEGDGFKTVAGPVRGQPHVVLGPKSTCHGRGPCGATRGAPSAATRERF